VEGRWVKEEKKTKVNERRKIKTKLKGIEGRRNWRKTE
jgi:hypothetical protein